MANSLAVLLRCANFQFSKNFSNCFRCSAFGVHVRQLYAKNVLGMDSYLMYKEKVKNQFAQIEDKFVEKMKEFSTEGSKNMVFTEDLKNMIHLAESDEDIDLVVKMIKKFSQQNSQLRFGNFVFGPVAMRMLYNYNKPDVAFELFKDPELSSFFDQLITYQILLDLLFENQKYEEMLEVFKIIQDKQVEGMKYPKNVVVLVYAALYKMNTKESLDYALKLWQEIHEYGHNPMRRACTFCAGLALNQGNAAAAFEVISSVKNQMYYSVRNIKAAALTELGRVEDALVVLKSILNNDFPVRTQQTTFNRDVLERIKRAVQKADRQDITAEFDRIYKIFEAEGHITERNLDEELCAEITGPTHNSFNRQDRFGKDRQQFGDDRRQRNNRSQNYAQRRPGLLELQ